jgi:hypothetical protein
VTETSSLRQCVGCKALPPTAETSHTHLSSSDAWRMRRFKRGNDFVVEWWCARCWRVLREGERAIGTR